MIGVVETVEVNEESSAIKNLFRNNLGKENKREIMNLEKVVNISNINNINKTEEKTLDSKQENIVGETIVNKQQGGQKVEETKEEKF